MKKIRAKNIRDVLWQKKDRAWHSLPFGSFQPKMIFKFNIEIIENIDDEFIITHQSTIDLFIRYILISMVTNLIVYRSNLLNKANVRMADGIHQPLTNGEDLLSNRDGNKFNETNVCKR